MNKFKISPNIDGTPNNCTIYLKISIDFRRLLDILSNIVAHPHQGIIEVRISKTVFTTVPAVSLAICDNPPKPACFTIYFNKV